MASRDEEQAPGIVRTHMLGPDASGTTGRSLGEPGSGALCCTAAKLHRWACL